MWNHKNNITLSLENTISFSRNITSHFTDREKIITLASIIIMLSFVNIINTSALSYQTETSIKFTFNPTINISLSDNLTITNLTPGTTADSNIINVSVVTNTSYGYTISALASSDSLIHPNNTNTFNNIATNANLESLTTDNTWGYSYKNNMVSTVWSNYNGLSTTTNKILYDTDNITSSSIDFKIAAKAGNAQPSGTYTNAINFYAVTKPTPMNLSESYFAAGKTRHNGYYAMQDMTSEICNNTEVIGEGSQTELIDLRDDKVYWATKLADGHCWMTQNLDLDLDSNRTYTHWDTDLGWDILDNNAEWKPINSTISFSGTEISSWKYSSNLPYSANPGNIYFYTSNSDTDDIQYNSLQECENLGHNDCAHYHAGNYYNWSAAVASNNTNNLNLQYDKALNSICPANWRLPITTNENASLQEFKNLMDNYNITKNYSTSGFINIRKSPLFMVRAGFVNTDGYKLDSFGATGKYQSSIVHSDLVSYILEFNTSSIVVAQNKSNGRRAFGLSVRCLAR